MRIKLKDAPKGYKHLEKFVFDVICGPMTETYRRKVACLVAVEIVEESYSVHLLKVVSTSEFSIRFETDGRLDRDIKSGIEPFHVTKNPTAYDKNDECLIGMTLHLNLDKFTVLPAGE